MVSSGVKLYEARKRLRKEYDKGKISAREYRQQKAVLDKALEQENIKGLEKLATAPQEKVIGTSQQAAIRTLQQKRTVTQQQGITQIQEQGTGKTYTGKVVEIDGEKRFIGVRTVTKREQQLRASERQGFYSIYPLTKEKPKAEILAEQTAIRGSLGIYSPYSLTSDVKFNFEKTEVTQPPKENFLKEFYKNVSSKTEKASTKFKYGNYKSAYVLSEFSGGVVTGFIYPVAYTKETFIGLAKLGIPLYYPEIAKGVYKEATTRPFRFAGNIAGGYAFNKMVLAPSVKIGAKAYYKVSDVYTYSLKPNIIKAIPEKLIYQGLTKRQFYQMKTEVADAYNMYRLESQSPFRVGRTLYIPNKNLGNVPDMKIKDVFDYQRNYNQYQPKQNIYIGLSKTGKVKAIDVETGIKTGQLIEVSNRGRVIIVPFGFVFGKNVVQEYIIKPSVNPPIKETFSYRKNVFNYPKFERTIPTPNIKIGGYNLDNIGTTSFYVPYLAYLPRNEFRQPTPSGLNIKPLNISNTGRDIKPLPKFDIKLGERQIIKPIESQIPRQRQKQESKQILVQTPAQITQQPTFNIRQTFKPLKPKLPKYPTLVGFTPKRQKQPKNSLFKGFNIRQPKAYFPSLRASLLGLKGKRDDDLTGLEERFL